MTTEAAQAKPAAKKKKTEPPVIKINAKFCKGCGICVAFCPTKVLEMKGGKVAVASGEKCIGCLFCELRCPDFAIAVFPQEK